MPEIKSKFWLLPAGVAFGWAIAGLAFGDDLLRVATDTATAFVAGSITWYVILRRREAKARRAARHGKHAINGD